MSDEKPQGESAPDTTQEQPPKPAPQVQQQTAPKPEPAPTGDNAPWLKERLERAERRALEDAAKASGFGSIDEMRAAATKAKELEDARKSEIERASEKIAALEGKAKIADEYSAALQRHADRELAALNEQQRAAVKDIAGQDPAKVLTAIDSLRPTWSAGETKPDAAQPAAPKPEPATTAAPPNAPPDGSTSPPDHKAVYESLRAKNPFQAAEYHLQHLNDISPS